MIFYNIRQYLTILGDLTLFDDIEQYLNAHCKHILILLYKFWKKLTIFEKIWQYLTILVDILQYYSISDNIRRYLTIFDEILSLTILDHSDQL